MNTEDKKPTITSSTTSKKSSKSVTQSDKNSDNSGGSGSSRKRRFSATNFNSTVSQVHRLPLKDGVHIKQEVAASKDAKLSGNLGGTTMVSHENLFSNLGMGFGEENRIKLFTNTLMKEIQSQIFAALSQPTTVMMASTANAKTKTTNRGN